MQKIIKQIPNAFTLLNLFFGCLAIVAVLQAGIVITDDKIPVEIPEKILYASLFIGIAAIVDFFDGFVARALKASSDMGKQLDSLADVVSFGVAPAMIAFQFLRLCYAQTPEGLEVTELCLYPAFLLPCAGAYRLARFNIDTQQTHGFKGVPIPAAGLVIAALPLVYFKTSQLFIYQLLLNKWFWYAVIIGISYLMVSTLPMLALKFKSLNLKAFMPFIIIGVVAVITAVVLGWVAVPVGFITYVIVSLAASKKKGE